MVSMRRCARNLIGGVKAFVLVGFQCVIAIVLVFVAIVARPLLGRSRKMFFGGTPIISFSHWSRAAQRVGYDCETVVIGYYDRINDQSDWDNVIDPNRPLAAAAAWTALTFRVLTSAEVIVCSFDGFLLRGTLSRFEPLICRLLGIKTVVIPYGADAYVYDRVHHPFTRHALNLSYPSLSRQSKLIASRVLRWSRHADVVIPGPMAFDGFPRWDVVTPSTICLDVGQWKRTSRSFDSQSPVVVSHSPNHRGFKGTEFIRSAIDDLRAEGLEVELLLMEGIKNTEVKKVLETRVDVHIEQIVWTGYALSGIEGMAAGLPVVANLEDEVFRTFFTRWSFLAECPVVSASPETIKEVLRGLVEDRSRRLELGRRSREYVETRHSYEAAGHLFDNVFSFLRGSEVDLPSLYAPSRPAR